MDGNVKHARISIMINVPNVIKKVNASSVMSKRQRSTIRVNVSNAKMAGH